jgi:hypothetical protein
MEQGALNSALLSTVEYPGATATLIGSPVLKGRRSMDIYNDGSNTVYIGGSGVTTANGRPIAAGGNYPMDVGSDILIYGIVATGSEALRILQGA